MDATPGASAAKKIFVSYTHEHSEHNDQVRGLAARLHEEGFDVEIDIFRQDHAEAWELWMRKAIKHADFVLVVCTETYRKRFEHEEQPGTGVGAKWEGAIISQALYEAESSNRKFIPVVFTPSDLDHRPDVLRGTTYYLLNTGANLSALLRYLRGVPEYVLGPRGMPGTFISQSPEPLRFDDEAAAPLANQPGTLVQSTGSTELSPNTDGGVVATRELSSAAQPGTLGDDIAASFDPAKRYVHIPFPKKGEQVIGRAAELEAVRTQLEKGRPTSIGQTAAFHGLGGLGKTQLAIEYAYTYEAEYSGGVYWFNADHDIEVQLTELAVVAGWVSPISEHRDKLELARHQIRSRTETLLIFDNVEDRAAIEAYLPAPAAGAHLLITSRLPVPGFSEIPLALLEEDQALAMLFSESGQAAVGSEEEIQAREIIRALDRLPLAIELAGAYLRYRPIGWAAYLERLQSGPRKALPGKFLSSFTRHEADLFKTLHVSDEIISEEPLLRRVLDLLTWSGTAPMGLSLMSAVLKPETEMDLAPALAHGVKLKLLQQTPGNQRFSLHRLVREVRREEVPLASLSPPPMEVIERLSNWFEARREDFAHLSAYEAEIDHLKAWERHAGEESPMKAARLLWLQAYPPFHRSNGRDVKAIVEKALAVLPQNAEGHERLKAHLLNDLACGEGQIGNRRRARELYEEAYQLRKVHCAGQPRELAQALSNLSAALTEDYELVRALALAERALEICKSAFGNEDRGTVDAITSIGIVHRAMGNLTEARSCAESALAICRSHFGDQHPRTAYARHVLGSTLLDIGELQLAMDEHRQAQNILAECLGRRDIGYAGTLGNIALVYDRLREYDKAVEYGERNIALVQELAAPSSPNFATALQNLGGFLMHAGQLEKALPMIRHALALKMTIFGSGHPNTAYSELLLGNCHFRLGDLDKAEEHERRAVSVRENGLGASHPLTALSQRNLAITLSDRGNREEAIVLFSAAVATQKQRLGPAHPETIATIRLLATCLHKAGRSRPALNILQELLGALPRRHVAQRTIENDISTLCRALPRRGRNFTPPKKKRRR